MENVIIYKILPHIFPLALTVSELLKFLNFDLQKVDQGHGAQFRCDIIPWQMLKSTKDSHTFLRLLLPFQRY